MSAATDETDAPAPPREAGPTKQLRVYLIDDHPIVRQGLARAISQEPQMTVVGQSSTGLDALRDVAGIAPDVVLVDLNLPDRDGIDLLGVLRTRVGDAKLLVVSCYEDELHVAEALRAGAQGYVVKTAALSEIIAAIQEVARGGTPLSPGVAGAVVRAMRRPSEVAVGTLDSLSPRERQVFRLLALGLSTRDAAARLDLSPKTVETHRMRIYDKLDCSCAVDLTRLAVREGLIDPEAPMRRTLRAVWLGKREYLTVLALQKRLAEARGASAIGDVVLLLEHEPVITLGRAADPTHVVAGEAALRARGVAVVPTGRGGDVTYHGPGQLVGYPILDLKPDRCDVRRYVRSLAEVMILLARDLDVEAGVVDGMIGVWADADAPAEWAGAPWARRPAKVGAIGVRLSRWITTHGFALNVDVDLDAFRMIVPCGIREHGVSSIAALTGKRSAVRDVALGCASVLARALDVEGACVEDLGGSTDVELEAALGLRA